MSFVLQRHLFRRVQTCDGGRRLRADGAQREEIPLVIRIGLVALRREHAEHAIARHDRDYQCGLRRDQVARFRSIQQTDGTLDGPVTNESRRPRADGLAGNALAERERPTGMLHAAINLAHDLDGLTGLVVDGEEEDSRVHHTRDLVVKRAEELLKVAGFGGETTESARQRKPRALLLRGGPDHSGT